jgi:hypothetical protein
MKTYTYGLVFCLAFCAIASQATAGGITFSDRVELGLTASQFFDPASGFTAGDTSHTNTVSTTVSGVKMDVTLTVEGLDAGGAAAGLEPIATSVGIDSPGGTTAEKTRINPGETLKVTFDSIAFSLDPAIPGMIADPASFATMSSIRLAAFDAGTDTYTYAGVGAGQASGDDTDTLAFAPAVALSAGDMFTITGDSGEFRTLYISLGGMSDIIPEPSTALLCLAMIGSATCIRRRK